MRKQQVSTFVGVKPLKLKHWHPGCCLQKWK